MSETESDELDKPDREVDTMAAVYRLLKDYDADVRARMLRWVHARIENELARVEADDGFIEEDDD